MFRLEFYDEKGDLICWHTLTNRSEAEIRHKNAHNLGIKVELKIQARV